MGNKLNANKLNKKKLNINKKPFNEKLYDKKSSQTYIFINDASCVLKNKINEQQLKIAYFMIEENNLEIYIYKHKIIDKTIETSKDVTRGRGLWRGRNRMYTKRVEEGMGSEYTKPFLFATIPLFGEILNSKKTSCIQVKIKKDSWNKVMKTSLEKLSACFKDDTYEVEYLGFDDNNDTFILYLTPEKNKNSLCSYPDIEDYKNNLKF